MLRFRGEHKPEGKGSRQQVRRLAGRFRRPGGRTADPQDTGQRGRGASGAGRRPRRRQLLLPRRRHDQRRRLLQRRQPAGVRCLPPARRGQPRHRPAHDHRPARAQRHAGFRRRGRLRRQPRRGPTGPGQRRALRGDPARALGQAQPPADLAGADGGVRSRRGRGDGRPRRRGDPDPVDRRARDAGRPPTGGQARPRGGGAHRARLEVERPLHRDRDRLLPPRRADVRPAEAGPGDPRGAAGRRQDRSRPQHRVALRGQGRPQGGRVLPRDVGGRPGQAPARGRGAHQRQAPHPRPALQERGHPAGSLGLAAARRGRRPSRRGSALDRRHGRHLDPRAPGQVPPAC